MNHQALAVFVMNAIIALGTAAHANAAGGPLSIERQGSNIVVRFDGQLQLSSAIDGPFQVISGASSPFLILATNAQMFLRSICSSARDATFAAGYLHTVALREDGSLWSWGNQSYGQLGSTNFAVKINGSVGFYTNAPGKVDLDTNWLAVACGYDHTIGLKRDGSLWAWGNNFNRQLGFDLVGQSQAWVPTRVGVDSDWRSAACGMVSTHAIKQDGSLWAWGTHPYTNYSLPSRIGSDSDWQAVACGSDLVTASTFTVALKTNGSLWSWGDNQFGQLGIGNSTGTNFPSQIGTNRDWTSVACGGRHAAGIRSDGTLWAWGNNGTGQLGIGTPTSVAAPVRTGSEANWQSVSCGRSFTAAIKRDGSLWTWGGNGFGQLGNGSFTRTNSPSRVGSDNNWQTIVCGGGTRFGNSFEYTVARKNDGSLWAWGSNVSGQLGAGNELDTNQPVPVVGGAVWGFRK